MIRVRCPYRMSLLRSRGGMHGCLGLGGLGKVCWGPFFFQSEPVIDHILVHILLHLGRESTYSGLKEKKKHEVLKFGYIGKFLYCILH